MKYLITDPCYLLDLDSKNKDRIWNLCINDMYDSDHHDKYDDRTDYTGVQKILSEELGINVLRVSDTGYGDWSNSISSSSEHIKIIKNEFYADAGMMCVVEINDKLENFLKDNSIGAIFESDIPVSVHVDDSYSDWFILRIADENDCYELVSSEGDEMNDYEDDEYDSEKEYDDYNDYDSDDDEYDDFSSRFNDFEEE